MGFQRLKIQKLVFVGLLAMGALLSSACTKKKSNNTPAPSTSTPDTTAPTAITLTSPSSLNHVGNVNPLTVSGSCETGATVIFAGDHTEEISCASGSFSKQISKSSDGAYQFRIKQRDSAGNNSVITTLNWTLDQVAPGALSLLSPSTTPHVSGDDSVSIVVGCEAGSTVSISGSHSESKACTNAEASFTFNSTVNGSYVFSLAQSDAATNTSSSIDFEWVRDDSVPPAVTVTTPATLTVINNASSLEISGACVDGNTVYLTGDLVAADVTGNSLSTACSSSAYQFFVNKSVDGVYKIDVYQETVALITSASVRVSWTRDTVAPAAPVISNPASSPYTAPDPLYVSGSCETGASVSVGAHTPVTCSGGVFSTNISEATDATYNYNVTQTDPAGNTSAASAISWVRDSSSTPPPVIVVPSTSAVINKLDSIEISGSCITNSTIEMFGDVIAGDVSPGLTQTCTDAAFSFSVTKLVDGTYNISLKQIGVNTVESSSVSISWTRDTVAPSTTIGSMPTDPNLSLTADFSFSSDDSSATFECSLDGAAFSACTSPYSNSTISNGARTFAVRAKDLAGNIDSTPATYSWTQGAYKTMALYHFNAADPLGDGSLYQGTYDNDLLDNSSSSTAGHFSEARLLQSATPSWLSNSHNATHNTINSVMTIEAFVNFNTLPLHGQAQIIVSRAGAAGNISWELRVRGQGPQKLLTFNGSVDGTNVVEAKTQNCGFVVGTTYHVAVTFNRGAVKLYCDGVAKGSGTIGTSGSATLYASTADIRVGRSEANSDYFDGWIDELRISQVLRYSAGFTPMASEITVLD